MATTRIITRIRDKESVKSLIDALAIDGSMEVAIKKVDKSSSAKQRRLKWRWNKEIADSGIGFCDTTDMVHRFNKKKFGHAILMRDDLFYADMFRSIRDAYQAFDDYEERMYWFVDNHIKTEKFTLSQQAIYLTDVQKYWTRAGVWLTDPATQGLDLTGYKRSK